jgi:type I restriction enzyme, R subunit
MSSGPEYELVEKPLIDQLVGMGWTHTVGDVDDPAKTLRTSFRDVFLRKDLDHALRKLNLRDGAPWMDDARVSQAVASLERIGESKLLEINQGSTEVIIKGVPVEGIEGWDHGRQQMVRFIDWETPGNNVFRVINQFRVDEPGGQAKKFICPDLVLFVNGIPLVVIECKSPYINEPIAQAVDQLQRYANQREWVTAEEGNERLFWTNQLVVATSFDEARLGTFTSNAVHFLEWKDTAPVAMSEVAQALGKATLASQELLAAGALRPEHLLDIARHFTLFMQVDGRTIKVAPRYQQFRAVREAVLRLKTGKTRKVDGEFDRRGGIVWHTQGSGKSLTMVFLIRKLRSDPRLRPFKIVVVTDRRDLQKQLGDTAKLTDEVLNVVKPRREGLRTKSSAEVLQETLRQEGKDLVFAMIQKYQAPDAAEEEEFDDDGVVGDAGAIEFPLLNESESILVLVDEAHRSHTTTLHANLKKAMPNCALIGFTGTPIIMGAKKRTHEIFGEFIDRYTIRQSEADGSTVPILYEGRTTRAGVKGGGGQLDQLFEDMFDSYTPEQLEAIKAKYGTKGNVLEAPAMIGAKARDMFRHYVANILPNGFKAQVVTVSRRAAVRYYEAFEAARAELVAELEALDPAILALPAEELEKRDEVIQHRVRAHKFLPTIRELEFAPIISGAQNDDPALTPWTDASKNDARIERFKKPLFHADKDKRDPLAFLIVKSMLLTGFDAPVAQVMYLDRMIREAELLQAIARVNRTSGEKKRAGFVVDYYGVAQHLKEALDAYSADDIEGALQSLKDEIPKLRDRHQRVKDIFTQGSIPTLDDDEACVRLLRDDQLRAEFQVKLKQFLSTLDVVLPRPEALPYVPDAKRLAYIQARVRNRYDKDALRLVGKEVGEKVRQLIDDHIEAHGIDPKIPPISLTDANFAAHIDGERSPRAKASEMEHALRYHIREHFEEDEEHYKKLSERLESILRGFGEQWDALVEALRALVDEARKGRTESVVGLDPALHMPFFNALKAAASFDETLTAEQQSDLVSWTVELVSHLRRELSLADFWTTPEKQRVLRNWIVEFLDGKNDTGKEIVKLKNQGAAADRLIELAKANRHRLGEA